MKKIITILLITITATTVHAQETSTSEQNFYKHEIGVSYGILPSVLLLPALNFSAMTLNFDYTYNFNKKHAITALLTYYQSFLKKWENVYYIAPQIGYKYTYLQTNNFTFFLTVAVGVQLLYIEPNDGFFQGFVPMFAYQISPLCFSIGKKHNFDLGLGLGSQGILKLGYRYKF